MSRPICSQPFVSGSLRVSLLALAVLALAQTSHAQQAFQFPTSIGSANGFQPVVDVSGNRMILRRNVAGGDEIGIVDGVGGIVFAQTFNAATSAMIPDPKLARGAGPLPATMFFTFPVAGGRQLRSATIPGGVQSSILTLPPGNWRLAAINSTNTAFFLLDSGTGAIGRVTTSGTPTFLTLGSVLGTVKIDVSPNDLRLALYTSSGAPFSPNPVLTMSVNGGAPTTVLSTSLVRTQAVWMDNRFIVCVALVGTAEQVIRIDTFTPGNPVTQLTQAPVRVESSNGFDMSDDRQWMAFVVTQQIGGVVEKVVAAMRVSDGTTADPGGAYIILGDYRDPAQPSSQALTNWQLITGLQIRHFPTAPTGVSTVHVVHSGRRAFTDPVEFFRTDVRDEIQITPRVTPGDTSTVSSIAPPFGVVWGMFVSLGREPVPVVIPGITNPVLISNPLSLFSVVTTPNAPIAVPLTISSDPLLSGNRLFFQSVWLINQPGTPLHLSQVSELPVF